MGKTRGPGPRHRRLAVRGGDYRRAGGTAVSSAVCDARRRADGGGTGRSAAMNLALLILIAGVLHFGILIASALTPRVLDWRGELAKLDRLTQQLVWVHGAFIVLVIVGFGLLSVTLPAELASGTLLARAVCGFIAFFWIAL